MEFQRRYTFEGTKVVDQFTWVERSSKITNPDGKVVYAADNLIFPKEWSQTAIDMVAQKYFRKAGVPDFIVPVPENVPAWLCRRVPAKDASLGAETDCRQYFHRLAGCWTYHAWKNGYFGDAKVSTKGHIGAEIQARAFYDEVFYMLAAQIASPNSPQHFNSGLHWAYGITGEASGYWRWDAKQGEARPTTSLYEFPAAMACFINTVKDDLVNPEGIMDLWLREAKIFKLGSGAGSNYSEIRGAGEPLSGGGKSSGLMSWLKIGDASSGAIKSGGTVRRSARMLILNMDHPDIEEFINWKVIEEDKVAALMVGARRLQDHANAIMAAYTALNTEAAGSLLHEQIVQDKSVKAAIKKAKAENVPGAFLARVILLAKEGYTDLQVEQFTADFEGKAYQTVSGQNANNSVRIPNLFMDAVEREGDWMLFWRTELRKAKTEGRIPAPCKTLKAKELWDELCYAAWSCADPGVQFDDTINEWNTVANFARIRATNPCQPATATVITPEGIRTFADIDVGSTIWSGSKWTKVIRKVATGVKNVFKYRTRGGCFVGTGEHQVFQNGERARVQDAETIDRCSTIPIDFPVTIDAKAVMAGLVIGDGGVKVCNDGANHYPLLYIGQKDHEYLVEPGVSDLITKESFDRKAYRVQTEICRDECPALPKREIPKRYFYANRDIVCSFLRGLYSANGSICGERVTLKSTSAVLVDQVQEMLSFVGISSYVTINKPTTVTFSNGDYECKESYALNITTGRRDFRRLVGFIQTNKKDRLDEICKIGVGSKKPKPSFDIVKTESLGEMPVFDITVDAEEHSYWSGGLLVSNCSEFNFVDDTSCNLASINLARFLFSRDDTWHFHTTDFQHAVRLWTIVLDITVSMAQFPSEAVARNAHLFRTLGLGFANLGASLMIQGIPYNSEKGRAIAAAITALMHFTSGKTSVEIAGHLEPFPAYLDNAEPMQRVMRNHVRAAGIPVGDEKPWKKGEPMAYEGLTIKPVEFDRDLVPQELLSAIDKTATEMLNGGHSNGYRNAQITLIAPTGTIAMQMDCDTTGVEPDFALVKFKKLAGGGYLKIVNESIAPALKSLGYSDAEIDDIMRYIIGTGNVSDTPEFAKKLKDYGFSDDGIAFIQAKIPKTMDMKYVVPDDFQWGPGELLKVNATLIGHGTIEGAPHIKEEHLPVFDCANKCGLTGKRSISPEGHVDMVAAIQPFLSGSSSKTINLPDTANEGDFHNIYWRCWEKMVKSAAAYRDGSKMNQPLASSLNSLLGLDEEEAVAPAPVPPGGAPPPNPRPVPRNNVRFDEIGEVAKMLAEQSLNGDGGGHTSPRRKLPARRLGYTQKARVGGHAIYVRTGEYKDGTLGEIFLDLHREGAAFRSMTNAWAMAISIGLQHGVPLSSFVNTFTGFRFDPSGVVTGHDYIKMATSMIDYVMRELAITYLDRHDLANVTTEEAESTTIGGDGQRSGQSIATEDCEGDTSSHGSDTSGYHGQKSPAVVAAKPQSQHLNPLASRIVHREASLKAGFSGDACWSCGSFSMIRSGTCLTCTNCNASSGC